MQEFESRLAAWKALYDQLSAARAKLQRPERLDPAEVEQLKREVEALRERSEAALKDLQADIARTAGSRPRR